MKIWTEESLKPAMDDLEQLLNLCREWYDAAGGATFTRIKHKIQDGAQEVDDSTIYGFRVRDLVPLAEVLRAKGVSPKEVTDWHEGLQRLMDFVLDQEKETLQKAVADLLKGLEGPDEETKEWFVKAIGSKGEEG